MTDTRSTTGTGAADDTPRQQIRETGSLVGDALTQVTSLVRGEMDLFRAEVDQNVKEAGAGIGMIVGGVVIMLVALNVLASALVVALTEAGLEAGWSALIVGVALAVIAAILAKSGTGKLKSTSLAPTRTAKNVRRDGEAVKKAI